MSDDIIEQVRNFYDEAGSHFSRTRQKTYGTSSANWPITDRYLSRLKTGQSVLDIGCGNGKIVSGLPKGVEYIGTDFSRTLLAEAKRLYPDHEFRMGNVVEASHWEGLAKFDAIFCVALLHHIPEREQQLYVLRQVKKHLKKDGPASTREGLSTRGGFLYLSVWNLWQEQMLQYHIDGHAEVPYDNKWKRYCVPFDIQSLTDLVTEAGLKVEELFYADHAGRKADVLTGQNLVCVAE